MNINFANNGVEQNPVDIVQQTRLTFDNSENVIYFYDIEAGKYDYMNKAIVSLTGYTMEELNEKGFDSIVVQKIKTETKSDETFVDTASGFSVEDISSKCLIRTKKGDLKWIENISFVRVDRKGNRSSCIGVLKNVTSVHRLVEQLQGEKDKLDSILDIADVVFIIIDAEYKVAFINKKGCSLFGYSKDEIVDKNWVESFIPDETKNQVKNLINSMIAGNGIEFENFENEVLTKSGERLLVSWHNFPLYDDQHNIKYIIASGQDITRSKRDEKVQQVISEILHAANSEKNIDEFFRMIHSSISKLMPAHNFYISLYEKANNLISFPYLVDEFDDFAPPKKFGKGLTEYVLTTGKPSLVSGEKDEELIKSGETEMVGTPAAIWLGVPLKIKDNTIGVMVLQDYNNPKLYSDKDKDILEVISYPISRAIERKIVEQERTELIARLKELNESKDKLFSLISHDLRSPFNSLLGFSEILTSEFESLTQEEIKEYLNVIYETSKNLYSMTNNLLQFSRFQMGRFDFNPVKINLKKLILSSLNLLKGNIIKKQLNMSIDIDLDAEVFADEDMLNSIVQNLLSNAIKFTNRGGDIKIRERILTFFDEPNQVEIAVEDSGVGISKEDTDKIFKEHMHSSPGTEKEYGTGLGLLLVKEFVQINGGQIMVKSKAGKGTTFIFTLPVLG